MVFLVRSPVLTFLQFFFNFHISDGFYIPFSIYHTATRNMSLDKYLKPSDTDLIELAQINTDTAPQLSKIEELWRAIELPTLRDILSYPAMCPYKKSTTKTRPTAP